MRSSQIVEKYGAYATCDDPGEGSVDLVLHGPIIGVSVRF
jgi:hypothetical protein